MNDEVLLLVVEITTFVGYHWNAFLFHFLRAETDGPLESCFGKFLLLGNRHLTKVWVSMSLYIGWWKPITGYRNHQAAHLSCKFNVYTQGFL